MKLLSALLLSLLLVCGADAQTFPGQSPGGVYSARNFGMVCDGTTDDTAAFNALLTTVANAGGGTIQLSTICLISGQVTFPSTNTYPIRITGTAGAVQLRYGGSPLGPAGLDLRFNASIAKFDMRGAGSVEIDHLLLKDGGSDCAAFIRTTNTALFIHDNIFIGSAFGFSACNDGIIFGGTSTLIGTQDPNAPFQGYITRVTNNTFSQMRAVGVWNTYANGIMFDHNTIDNLCGSNVKTAITAATNANPAVLTIPGHGFVVGSTINLNITGATGNWTPINTATFTLTTQNPIIATVLDANTVSIPINSTTFGALTGSPAYFSGSAFVLNGLNGLDGGNFISENLIELSTYGYMAHLIGGQYNSFINNSLFDSVAVSALKIETTYNGFGVYIGQYGAIPIAVGPGNLNAFTNIDPAQPWQISQPVKFTSGTGVITFSNGGGVDILSSGGFTTEAGAPVVFKGPVTFNNSGLGLTMGTNTISGSTATFTSSVTAGGFIVPAGSVFQTAARARLFSPGDGIWTLWNSSNSGFTRLQFGGSADSFPALAPNSFGIQATGGAGGMGMIGALAGAFASLPSCASGLLGMEAVVNNSTTATVGATITGGGTNKVKAICNSANNWIVETAL